MDTQQFSVQISRDGPVCLLAVAGDLDSTAATDLADEVSQAVAVIAAGDRVHVERFVLDLSGLTWLDCAGARALSAVAQGIPDEYPIVVRAISPIAARLFSVLDMDLERGPLAVTADYGQDAVHELLANSLTARALVRQALEQLAETAARLASTEDRVAVAFIRRAQQNRARATRLTLLSEQARRQAIAGRHRASESLG